MAKNVFSNYKKVLMDKVLGRIIETSIENNFESFQDSFQYTQSMPSSLWTVVHNYGSTDVTITVFINDKNGSLVNANPTISFTDTNTIVLDFAGVQTTGIVNLIYWGDVYTVVSPSGCAISYDQTVLSKSPIAYWPFNQTSIATGQISSSDAVGGIIVTGNSSYITALSDSYGNTMDFLIPDTTAHAGLTMASAIPVSNNYSLECWFEPAAYTNVGIDSDGYFTLIGADNVGVNNYYGLQIEASTKRLFIYGNTDTTYASGFQANLDTLYHVVVSVDASKNVTWYINGITYTSATTNVGSPTLVDDYTFHYIGNNQHPEYFVGIIGNVAIYNHALSQSEALENYNKGLSCYRYSQPVPIPSVTPTPSVTTTPLGV